MAVIKTMNTQTQKANDRDDKTKPVDLSDNSLKSGVKSKLDPTEDAWSRTAPPPKGDYDIKLFAGGKDAWRQGLIDENDEDSIYYSCNLECKIVSENKEYDGASLFSTVTTRIGRGKHISTMAGLIKKCGYKVPEEATPLEIARLFKKVLAKEPILRGNECDWEGYSKADSKTIFLSMDDFPEDSEGNKRWRVTRTTKDGSREEIVASLRIKLWGDSKATNKTQGEGAGTGKGKGAIKPLTISNTPNEGEGEEAEEVEEEGKGKGKDKGKGKGNGKSKTVEEEEEDDLEAAEDDD